MSELQKCPCGEIPEKVGYCENGQGCKWMVVYGSCCGDWQTEFRTEYTQGDELKKIAEKAWNDALRSKELKGASDGK